MLSPAKVSVIIPTYNRPHYLRQAIESVLAQTYANFELIVIDDGSTDDTRLAVKQFDDPRIKYLYQNNAGRSTARNHGLEVSTGDYVSFLDDDDLYLPHKLTSQTAFLKNNGWIDLVASGTNAIDHQGQFLRSEKPWLHQPELTLAKCLYSCPLPTCSVLLRRNSLQRMRYWFDHQLDVAEDTDFFIRMLIADCEMAWLPEIVCLRRVHDNNSQGNSLRYVHAYRKLLNNLFAELELVPTDISSAEQLSIRVHYKLVGACLAYATGEINIAQSELLEAVKMQPATMQGNLPEIVAKICSFADTSHVDEPIQYISFVFDHLPPELVSFADYRSKAISAYYMRHVFKAHKSGQPIPFRYWLNGVRYSPQWLLNRGVWSIGIQSLGKRGA